MEGFIILLVLLAICCFLCGPAALIISIIALNKSRTLDREPLRVEKPIRKEEVPKPAEVPKKPVEVRKVERPTEPVTPAKLWAAKVGAVKVEEPKKLEPGKKVGTLTLEQRIGTRWILIAGVITVVFSVGFFLKYAYDNEWIGPLGRVVIAAIGGLVALAVGEVTRRRGYGIVAKGVTALGFAILYAAVFSARAYYELIDTTPAFALAILVTAAAMLYAVSLNEIVVAFLSLLGGFLTPVLVSTGENRPNALFTYTLILGVGAMLCALYRKWRAVNVLSFVGTFLLYTGWFEKFYRPTMKTAEGAPEQIAIALVWLGVFLAVYLVLPLLYELVKKVKAKKEDVILVLANAAVVFYYLWMILFAEYRQGLAFCALGLCAAHLAMMSAVAKRCVDDLDLRLALLAIGLFFLTIAIPLYLKMYAIAMAWAVEGVILAVIGLRYRSIWTQVGAAVALLLSFAQLLHRLPMHTAAFTPVFNQAFGTWCFVTASLLVCYIIYRRTSRLAEPERGQIAQFLYAATVLLLMAAVAMEWWWHCDYNVVENTVGNRDFIRGMVIIFTIFPLLFLIRPICPRGIASKIISMILAGVGAIITTVAFSEVYIGRFRIFVNVDFAIVLLFVAGLFVAAILLKRSAQEEQEAANSTIFTEEYNIVFATIFTLAAIFVLWILLTEQIYLYWYCRNRFAEAAEKVANWMFLSHMYISVMWAVYGAALMVAGFWRKAPLLRYIALGLFVLLLVKVFILDTSTVKSVYRIAAFLATGITLVGVSYLYQFLRKKGFFDAMLAEKNLEK
ncbi:MAG: DUF2339 domain-containing protein [Phycisphaerae bacterium]|nr:DUF2339 domain-containing protein [Phycisphaerae bacterium]